MTKKYAVHVCSFESTGHLVGKARTFYAIKAAVLEAGRFSVFDINTDRDAKMFTRLCAERDIVTFEMGFPWTGVRRRDPWDAFCSVWKLAGDDVYERDRARAARGGGK